MTDGCFLGIDTSNYTTSVAVVAEDGKELANLKYPLPVKDGERGLRQSDALFSHTVALPRAMEDAKIAIGDRRVLAVGVSTRPRNVEGSYMPCFLAGLSAATAFSVGAAVPLYRFSHQCGHIMAALYASESEHLLASPFYAAHVSGGTTELLSVRAEGAGFRAERIGGTKDVNAGQLIDRVGVAMGLHFPCGPAMERLALSYKGRIPKRAPRTDGAFVNFSGAENLALKIYGDTGDPALTAAFLLSHIGEGLSRITEACMRERGEAKIVFAGGVMSNSILKERLKREFGAFFADPLHSADNAVGIAVLARRQYFSENEIVK